MQKDDDEAYQRGLRLGLRLGGPAFQETIDALRAADPALVQYVGWPSTLNALAVWKKTTGPTTTTGP